MVDNTIKTPFEESCLFNLFFRTAEKANLTLDIQSHRNWGSVWLDSKNIPKTLFTSGYYLDV